MVAFRRGTAPKAVALVALLILGTAAVAFARWGEGPISISNENVTYDGRVDWNPNAQTAGYGHGGMVVRGYLKDTHCNGHWVYVSAKVEGYGYARLKENHEGCGDRVWDAATEVYDPAATWVTNGYVKACQDDSWSDTCTEEFMHR